MIDINSKEELSESVYKTHLKKLEQQLIDSAKEKFKLIARVNQLEEQLSLRLEPLSKLKVVWENTAEADISL